MIFLHSIFLIFLSIFSYCFVDGSFPYKIFPILQALLIKNREFATLLYVLIIITLFLLYFCILYQISKNKILIRNSFFYMVIPLIILLFSYPAFSNDIFNYIATAKISFFYGENPYIVMPIEIKDEPMLIFMHAANKTALYGPAWIILTFIPHLLGLGNLLLSIFSFKLFTGIFYAGVLWFIWKLSNKNILSLIFFALNPLVLIEAFISGHNDIVMIFFALFSFYQLKKNQYLSSMILIFISILIKYATLFLFPVYLYCLFKIIKKEKILWGKIWFWSFISMFIIFLLSPIREEIYAWYFIWPLTFVSLMGRIDLAFFISLGFSFGLCFRIVPFILTNSWTGITPIIKKIVTFIPPLLFGFFYVYKNYRKKI